MEPGGDVVTVERDLVAYYEQEAGERAGRALDPRRVAVRAAFLARLGARTGRLLEVGIGPGRDAAAFVADTVRCLPFDEAMAFGATGSRR